MVRAPCCEKMGVKRGPWTPEEDRTLINYINLYGHGNWRALPKQAGLLRCGKSCRLRWTNYLRPDIKRGNFSMEEEETIIELHEKLGNRWSAIAARLAGRTDNEIKNVWHTHLKKRLNQNKTTPETKQPKSNKSIKMQVQNHELAEKESEPINYPDQMRIQSPQNSSSGISSSSAAAAAAAATSSDTATTATTLTKDDISADFFPEVDDNFWSDVFSAESSSASIDFPADPQVQFQFSPLYATENVHGFQDGMDFLFNNLFTTAGELPDFLDL